MLLQRALTWCQSVEQFLQAELRNIDGTHTFAKVHLQDSYLHEQIPAHTAMDMIAALEGGTHKRG